MSLRRKSARYILMIVEMPHKPDNTYIFDEDTSWVVSVLHL